MDLSDLIARNADFTPDKVALRFEGRNLTYAEFTSRIVAAARALKSQLGVARGDRVAILLPQAPEVAAIHIAIYKLGAIALPLASLFGVDALSYRLQNAGVKAIVCNAAGMAKLAAIRAELPALALFVSVDSGGDGALGFADLLSRASPDFPPVATAPDLKVVRPKSRLICSLPRSFCRTRRIRAIACSPSGISCE